MILSSIAIFLFSALALSSSAGDFKYFERLDPIDDQLQVVLFATNNQVTMSVSCFHRRSKTIFVTIDPIRSLDTRATNILYDGPTVSYRIDDNEHRAAHPREVSYDRFILEGSEARSLAQRMANGDRLFVRVPGYSTYIDVRYDISGLRPLIHRVAERCGDKRLIKRLGL